MENVRVCFMLSFLWILNLHVEVEIPLRRTGSRPAAPKGADPLRRKEEGGPLRPPPGAYPRPAVPGGHPGGPGLPGGYRAGPARLSGLRGPWSPGPSGTPVSGGPSRGTAGPRREGLM